MLDGLRLMLGLLTLVICWYRKKKKSKCKITWQYYKYVYMFLWITLWFHFINRIVSPTNAHHYHYMLVIYIQLLPLWQAYTFQKYSSYFFFHWTEWWEQNLRFNLFNIAKADDAVHIAKVNSKAIKIKNRRSIDQ